MHSLNPDNILNSLVYRTLFYVNIYGSYKLSKNSPVFFAHPAFCHTFLISHGLNIGVCLNKLKSDLDRARLDYISFHVVFAKGPYCVYVMIHLMLHVLFDLFFFIFRGHILSVNYCEFNFC